MLVVGGAQRCTAGGGTACENLKNYTVPERIGQYKLVVIGICDDFTDLQAIAIVIRKFRLLKNIHGRFGLIAVAFIENFFNPSVFKPDPFDETARTMIIRPLFNDYMDNYAVHRVVSMIIIGLIIRGLIGVMVNPFFLPAVNKAGLATFIQHPFNGVSGSNQPASAPEPQVRICIRGLKT